MTAAEPFPATGGVVPDFAANRDRVAAASAYMRELYVESPGQEALIAQFDALRLSCIGARGSPLPGRRLLQASQAGKTITILEFRRRLAKEDADAGRQPNPYRAIHIELRLRITVKMLYQRVLRALGDPESHGRYNVDTLMQRCEEFMELRGTEIIFVDEVQYIAKDRRDSHEVADELKGFIDMGLAPVVFIGNEEAEELFKGNERLTGRLGAPLELPPAQKRVPIERRAYRRFLKLLDAAVADAGHSAPSGLDDPATVRRLHGASGGHRGRTFRIVEAALAHACARGADRIEVYDLSHAVDHLAIPARWSARNPFPRPDAW